MLKQIRWILMGLVVLMSCVGEARSSSDYSTYKVRRGDALDAIARRFGTDSRTLKALNSIANSDELATGQVIRIPKPAVHPSASKASKPTAAVGNVRAPAHKEPATVLGDGQEPKNDTRGVSVSEKTSLCDIDVSGAGIKFVVEALAQCSGANIVASPEITGPVSYLRQSRRLEIMNRSKRFTVRQS